VSGCGDGCGDTIDIDISEGASLEARLPLEDFLRMDRMPHIWCPGCGIGSVVTSFAEALKRKGIDQDKVVVISGIGCTGRVAGYVHLDSLHTTHGRAITVATGMKLGNPDLHVVVISGEGDLLGIGGNHFIHAARRNLDITVICVNNLTYGMTGGQSSPSTPLSANSSTAPYGNFDQPFNFPWLAEAAGATYVARWNSMETRRVTTAIEEAMEHKGFSFVEVMSPCTTLYLRRNRLGDGVDWLNYFKEFSVIEHGADTSTLDIDFQGKIVMGKFVDNKEKIEFIDAMNQQLSNVIGEDYELYGTKKDE
jgi:2-oxoglutarate ferredoxin oxidoreductase subunit beta